MEGTPVTDLMAAGERVVGWLRRQVIEAARGDHLHDLTVEPSNSFWLGRIAPEGDVAADGTGHLERLNPCSIGIRVRPATDGPWRFEARVRARAWLRDASKVWRKTGLLDSVVPLEIPAGPSAGSQGEEQLSSDLAAVVGVQGLVARVDHTLVAGADGKPELTIRLVNCTGSVSKDLRDTNLYEVQLDLRDLAIEPFVLAALPDSFRYDRRVWAYGSNCGVALSEDGTVTSCDFIAVPRARSDHLGSPAGSALTFRGLSTDPLPLLRGLVEEYRSWGAREWSDAALRARSSRHHWTAAMEAEAADAAEEHRGELRRLEQGIEALAVDDRLLLAFKLMNEAMAHASRGRYSGWRPFQVAFILAVLPDLRSRERLAEVVDTLWFPTGGGKTETYLGVLVVAILLDRLRGKETGITAWSRFPLRMLSLQQTQRFADALAGAELARRSAKLGGAPISLGFFVGEGATPNRIKVDAQEGDPANPDDEGMPERYRILLRCPFCHGETIHMAFERKPWRLEHRCSGTKCPWGTEGLPFYVVDDEIYRFLPTVVVGTLDKAASIGFQASMRGFLGAPWGTCSEGHGFVYAPRSDRPSGCLSPGCRGSRVDIPRSTDLAPTLRLQDELHLLRDTLGAVDSHYEALLDQLQLEIAGYVPKVLASSATLSGQEAQIAALYRRPGRVFPLPGPSTDESFWTKPSAVLEREYVALAPRGVTLEYAADRLVTELQKAIRRFQSDKERVCAEVGVDVDLADQILSLYGTNVVYGSTLRDIEAVSRSLETQVPVDPLVTAALTGRVPFEEVRRTLHRLEHPEDEFGGRIHVVAASAMMSHGVDVDRLNAMVMLGLPLTTAEFIQTTARIGRRWPGLVFMLMKIGRERDAGIFRSFPSFVRHGDRFVEPIPITSRSRRVLAVTLAGMVMARILHVHEPTSGVALSTPAKLRAWATSVGWSMETEVRAIARALRLDDALDGGLLADVEQWVERFFRRLEQPPTDARFVNDLCPEGRRPMMSLRDVDQQIPVISAD